MTDEDFDSPPSLLSLAQVIPPNQTRCYAEKPRTRSHGEESSDSEGPRRSPNFNIGLWGIYFRVLSRGKN
ncbi:hypothetical protein Pyn_31856 [Prunus yedoensis var. nudiflora]|uniref:Uncharacterized protein n=1 Tax=Prunus yedoensis var. nudiflora TaxID=2094558 RepID=A0A314Y2M5_PRUYE|nr:hypothetical protein Pyn_31856 [Prunus yedoensis var. nudiflora]